ncbi:hypothetical protein [Viridibacterium curvum]|uniref:Uncharacterized protein n=1 Tax=Viridibacterium curvum TaxID=1101404 RepID=A0ABP9QE94_9RHOO
MATCPNSRVIKKLHPGDAGTLKLAERYGRDLVCVRYRETEDGSQRLTTIEIVVDVRDKRDVRKSPHPRPKSDDLVRVKVLPSEFRLRQRLHAYGARCEPDGHIWLTRWLIVKHLKLTNRLVK